MRQKSRLEAALDRGQRGVTRHQHRPAAANVRRGLCRQAPAPDAQRLDALDSGEPILGRRDSRGGSPAGSVKTATAVGTSTWSSGPIEPRVAHDPVALQHPPCLHPDQRQAGHTIDGVEVIVLCHHR
jgi:hypothetical protein